MRKLASIRRISEVHPIVGKDRVEMAIVDGWTCMVSKADNFIAGDLCVFCETDSVFPSTEEWEFLKKYNYRIKTQKFKDGDGNTIYSQGLVLPMSKLREKSPRFVYNEGNDVTDVFGITQYKDTRDIEEAQVRFKNPLMRFSWFRKLVGASKAPKGDFPDEVSKSDEERVQNCPTRWQKSDVWVATEKVDGSSATYLLRKKKGFFKDKYEFVVCSRNLQNNNQSSAYWKVAKKYDIENVLKVLLFGDRKWVCLQGEILGPGIQKNKYKFTDYEFRAFNLIDETGRYGSIEGSERISTISNNKIEWVPIIELLGRDWFEDKSVNDILTYANGKSKLNQDVKREGIVFRSLAGTHSFKAVSPEFLIKFDE